MRYKKEEGVVPTSPIRPLSSPKCVLSRLPRPKMPLARANQKK